MNAKTTGWIEVVLGILVVLIALLVSGDTAKWLEVIFGLLVLIFGGLLVGSK